MSFTVEERDDAAPRLKVDERGHAEVTDPRVMRAMAHPVRLAILEHLFVHGPATATECARAVGDSPSNCSYHLRTLARYGFVEEVETEDGRERRWRRRVRGWRTSGAGSGEQAAAETVLRNVAVERDRAALDRYLANEGEVGPEWREAAAFANSYLAVTREELNELTSRIWELVRPYSDRDPADRPEGARLVYLILQAFPRVDD